MFISNTFVLFLMVCAPDSDRCYKAALDGFQSLDQCRLAGLYFKAITEAVSDPDLPRIVYECHRTEMRTA